MCKQYGRIVYSLIILEILLGLPPVWSYIVFLQIYVYLEPVNVTIFGNRIFADGIKLR